MTQAEAIAFICAKVTPVGECLVYPSKKDRAYLSVDGKPMPVYRIVYEAAFGQLLSSSVFVLHRCDNGRCVRLSHLEAGGQAKNLADAVARHRKGTTGVLGVSYQKSRGRYIVLVGPKHDQVCLYQGRDFVAACAARKAYEDGLKELM